VRAASRQFVIKRFNDLDLHDDNLLSVTVHPPHSSRNSTRIDFDFQDDSTGGRKLLSFRGCANIRYVMDFDVLSSNWFAQTKQTVSHAETEKIRKLIKAQMAYWHVRYMPPAPKDKPIRKKLSSLSTYALFRIAFFGGIVEILAKDFILSRKRKS
jgi:hypothetical protein